MSELFAKEAESRALEFTESLKVRMGSDLKMVALYGSVIRGNFKPETSDINLLVVSSNLHMRVLKDLSPFVQKAKENFKVSPLFIYDEQIYQFANYFPIKFYEMKNFSKILYGEDLLKDIPVEWQSLKENVRQEILNMEMKLRKSMVMCFPNTNLLARPLRTFIPQVINILRVLVERPESKDFDEDDRFLMDMTIKKSRISGMPSFEEVIETYETLFENFVSLLKAVDNN